MLKLICLGLGLVVGFGGGVYWASHNPDAANRLSAEEEKRFLEAQMQISQKIQDKLDQLQNKTSPTAGSGFISSSQSGPIAAEVNSVKNDTQKQQAEIQKRLNSLK